MEPTQSAPACRNCTHFCNDPKFLEQAVPGLSSMSSAYASVRSDDGLCNKHDRYLSAGSVCIDFTLKAGR